MVTWPTRMVASDRSLATAVRAPATARTWVTPPGTPSTSAAAMVCTESMMSSRGLTCVDVPEHGVKVGLGGQEQPLADRADPVRAGPDLGRGLLAGHVEHRADLSHQRSGLQQQGGLAHPRLTRQQQDGAGHQPAAEDPVQLVQAGGTRARVGRIHLADGHRRGAGPGRRRGTRPGCPRGPAGSRRPPRPCPTPGTRRTARPTWWPASHTPCTGSRAPADDFAMACTITAATDNLSKLRSSP